MYKINCWTLSIQGLLLPSPWLKKTNNRAPNHLCPILHVDEGAFILLTHQMTSVPASILTAPAGSLETFSTEIIEAIDFLITGV